MSRLVDDVFYSSLIGRPIRYRALVPELGATPKRLPVLYLLHGLFGSHENWTDLTNLQKYAEGTGRLIVMPDGGDNWYTDSSEKYESYLIRDLLPAMENKFGAGTQATDRAIAGNSMGGYGAIKLALRHPELFSFAASFSGAFNATRPSGIVDKELAPSLSQVLGQGPTDIRAENDLFEIAEKASEKSERLPQIYFDCGADDPFILGNQDFSSTLSAVGIEHEFLEIEGGHDWPYWDERIKHLLLILK